MRKEELGRVRSTRGSGDTFAPGKLPGPGGALALQHFKIVRRDGVPVQTPSTIFTPGDLRLPVARCRGGEPTTPLTRLPPWNLCRCMADRVDQTSAHPREL